MKTKLLLSISALWIAGAVFFAGCEEKENKTEGNLFALVDIEEGDTLFISGEGAEAIVNLDSDYDWEVTEIPEWLSVDPDSGSKGFAELIFTATPLDEKGDVSERIGEFTLKASNDRTITITVKQSYDYPKNHTCKATPTAIVAPISASNSTFKVMCNAPWTATADSDWITLDKPSGGAGTVTVRVTIAASSNERSGKITIKSGNKSATVSVNQKISALEAILTAKKLTAPIGGSDARRTKKFYLNSNYPWSITTDNDWITINPTSGEGTKTHQTITATLTTNNTPRTGKITVKVHMSKSEDGEIVDHDEVREIPVYQVDDATGYWKDGETIYLHASYDVEAGRNPIPIALVMDGFDLGDLKKCPNTPTAVLNGALVANPSVINSYTEWSADASDDCVLERYVHALSDLLMRLPVVRDFEKYFDVRAYVAESNSRGKYDFTTFGWSWQHGPDQGAMWNKGYALFGDNYPKIREIKPEAESNVTFFFGSISAVGGFNQGDNCTISTPIGQNGYFYHLGHEYIGHTLGRIPDLYAGGITVSQKNIGDQTILHKADHHPLAIPGGTYTVVNGKERDQWTPTYLRPVGDTGGWLYPCYESQVSDGKYDDCDVREMVWNFAQEWPKGFNWNVDYETDKNRAVWHPFVNDPKYTKSTLGSYATGFNVFNNFRGPENGICMREVDEAHFSLGSRIWLWNQFLRRSGVPDPDDFGNWASSHPRSIQNFYNWDTDPAKTDIRGEIEFDGLGYADRPRMVFKEDSILKHKYWVDHDIYAERQNKDGGGF